MENKKNIGEGILTNGITYKRENYIDILSFLDIEYNLISTNNLTENDIENYITELDKVIKNMKSILKTEQSRVSEIVRFETKMENILKKSTNNIIKLINFIIYIRVLYKKEQNLLIENVKNIDIIIDNMIIVINLLIEFKYNQKNELIKNKINELINLIKLLIKTLNNGIDSQIRLNILNGRPYKTEYKIGDKVFKILECNIRIK